METTFKVNGMSCGHCVSAITAAITPLPGVEGVTVDLSSGQVRVTGTSDTDAVAKAIEDCGYDVADPLSA